MPPPPSENSWNSNGTTTTTSYTYTLDCDWPITQEVACFVAAVHGIGSAVEPELLAAELVAAASMVGLYISDCNVWYSPPSIIVSSDFLPLVPSPAILVGGCSLPALDPGEFAFLVDLDCTQVCQISQTTPWECLPMYQKILLLPLWYSLQGSLTQLAIFVL